eukprot:5202295-Amphidinium_carterae.1
MSAHHVEFNFRQPKKRIQHERFGDGQGGQCCLLFSPCPACHLSSTARGSVTVATLVLRKHITFHVTYVLSSSLQAGTDSFW